MSKFFICFFTMCLCASAYAQNNVGIGTSAPDASAVLDLSPPGKNLGFLVPRTRVSLVATPTAPGLVIFDTDTLCYVMYNGSTWKNLCSPTLPPQHLGFNDSVYYSPNGTFTVIDSAGNHILTSTLSAWLTTGNSGTTAGTNFVGTTDAQDLVIKSNNNEVIRATQNNSVGINTPVPDQTAVLQIQSPNSNQGVLFPSLTSAQRDALISTPPALGLTIYNSDLNVHQFWNGTCWVNVGQTVCSFTYSFTQSHTSDCLFKSNFNSVADTLTVSLISGTPSPVILSAAGVPAGVLCNFSNNYLTPTQTSVMTLTALPSAPDGTYTITILAASGSTIETLTYTLTVYDFAVTLTPNSSTVPLATAQAGGVIATSTLSIGNASTCNATAGNAQLAATIQNNTNNALTVTFGNPNLPVPGSTIMTVTSNCALSGTYQIYVTSTVGVSVSTSIYTLTIAGSVPYHIPTSQNVNLFVVAGQPTCPVVDTFYVDAGSVIGSDTSINPSMVTGNFTTGSHIVIINNGTIEGAGGTGGNQVGYGYLNSCAGIGDGVMGGDAIDITGAGVVIDNLSLIESGGGGGGAGGDLSVSICTIDVRPGAGGGGGAGSVPGQAGNNGLGSNPTTPGSPGTTTAGGNGGANTTYSCFFGSSSNGSGGHGGAPGTSGTGGGSAGGTSLGSTGVCPAGSGGAPGYSVNGGGNTYVLNGAAVVGPTHP